MIPKQERSLEDFAGALRGASGSVRRVVWILPPDSARYSDHVQSAVARLIRKVASQYRFDVVDSRAHTHYVVGKTGEDGVHYWKRPALEWANWVIDKLNRILRTRS